MPFNTEKVNITINTIFARAKCHMQDHRYYEAIEDYKWLVENFICIAAAFSERKTYSLNKKIFVAYFYLGQIYYEQLSDFKEAHKYLSLFLDHISKESNIRTSEAFLLRGHANRCLGEFSRAIKDYTLALSDKNNYYGAYYYRGQCYEEIGNIESALEDYNNVLLQYSLDEREIVDEVIEIQKKIGKDRDQDEYRKTQDQKDKDQKDKDQRDKERKEKDRDEYGNSQYEYGKSQYGGGNKTDNSPNSNMAPIIVNGDEDE